MMSHHRRVDRPSDASCAVLLRLAIFVRFEALVAPQAPVSTTMAAWRGVCLSDTLANMRKWFINETSANQLSSASLELLADFWPAKRSHLQNYVQKCRQNDLIRLTLWTSSWMEFIESMGFPAKLAKKRSFYQLIIYADCRRLLSAFHNRRACAKLMQ